MADAARWFPRLEGLSDLIFGLALSIGAVFLLGSPPTNVTELASDLAEFGFSFLVLISVWLRYTRAMSAYRVESYRAVRSNVVLLFLVAIEPFLFNVAFGRASFVSPGFSNLTTALYAVDLGGLLAILGALSTGAVRQEEQRGHRTLREEFRSQGYAMEIASVFFFVSALPWFYDWTIPGSAFPVRFLFWVMPPILGRFWRR